MTIHTLAAATATAGVDTAMSSSPKRIHFPPASSSPRANKKPRSVHTPQPVGSSSPENGAAGNLPTSQSVARMQASHGVTQEQSPQTKPSDVAMTPEPSKRTGRGTGDSNYSPTAAAEALSSLQHVGTSRRRIPSPTSDDEQSSSAARKQLFLSPDRRPKAERLSFSPAPNVDRSPDTKLHENRDSTRKSHPPPSSFEEAIRANATGTVLEGSRGTSGNGTCTISSATAKNNAQAASLPRNATGADRLDHRQPAQSHAVTAPTGLGAYIGPQINFQPFDPAQASYFGGNAQQSAQYKPYTAILADVEQARSRQNLVPSTDLSMSPYSAAIRSTDAKDITELLEAHGGDHEQPMLETLASHASSLVTPTPYKSKTLNNYRSEQVGEDAATGASARPYSEALNSAPMAVDAKCSARSYSRKKKSLAVLTENFMMLYSPQPKNSFIALDEAAQSLGVERRRIYDVVNILEALSIISRKHKNTYIWYGTTNLDMVFGALQMEACRHYSETARKNGYPVDYVEVQEVHEDSKCLGRLTKEFLKLYLVGHKTLSLPEVSNLIRGTMTAEEEQILSMPACALTNKSMRPDALKEATDEVFKKKKAAAERGLKTKVRRLYDIANVFLSVGLVRKTEAVETFAATNRRPRFEWSYRQSPKQIFKVYRKFLKAEIDKKVQQMMLERTAGPAKDKALCVKPKKQKKLSKRHRANPPTSKGPVLWAVSTKRGTKFLTLAGKDVAVVKRSAGLDEEKPLQQETVEDNPEMVESGTQSLPEPVPAKESLVQSSTTVVSQKPLPSSQVEECQSLLIPPASSPAVLMTTAPAASTAAAPVASLTTTSITTALPKSASVPAASTAAPTTAMNTNAALTTTAPQAFVPAASTAAAPTAAMVAPATAVNTADTTSAPAALTTTAPTASRPAASANTTSAPAPSAVAPATVMNTANTASAPAALTTTATIPTALTNMATAVTQNHSSRTPPVRRMVFTGMPQSKTKARSAYRLPRRMSPSSGKTAGDLSTNVSKALDDSDGEETETESIS